MKRIILKETQIPSLKNDKYKLPQDLFKQLKDKRTSLGDNPCFPSEKKYPFDYDIIKSRYKEVVDSLEKANILEEINLVNAKNLCNKLIQEVIEKEKPVRDLLNTICRNYVTETFNVPSDLVILKCHLVDNIDPKNPIRILPEDDDNGDNSYRFEDVDDIEQTNVTILQRRFLNSLIQGVSYIYGNDIDSIYDEVYKLDESLPKLYYYIRLLSDYILFNEEAVITEKNPTNGAYVSVNLGNRNKKTTIDSQAIILPYLITETIRGIFELFSAHGLPKDNKKAMFIIRHADFALAEQWDLRFGVKLWQLLAEGVEDPYLLPYYFAHLSMLETEEFNIKVKNILSRTNKGDLFKDELIQLSKEDLTFDDVPDDNEVEDVRSIISDDVNDDECFTLDELKNFDLNEIKLNEGITDIVYHFTNLDSLASIAFNDMFNCGFEEGKYYMSTTRQKSPLVGFPRCEMISNRDCVRLTLDGRRFKENPNITGEPYSFFKDSKVNLSDYPDKNKFIGLDNLVDDESEDRIYPKHGTTIPNFSSYILRIDAYIDATRVTRFTIDLLRHIISRMTTQVNVYTKHSDFAIQNNNYISAEEFIKIFAED